jgi:glycosyltransferase involved in cell wall biosynthesis
VRVVVATHSLFTVDGIAKSSLDICRSLVRDGHEVCLVYPDRSDEMPLLAAWRTFSTQVCAVPDLALQRRHPLQTSQGLAKSARTIRRLHGDVVYIHQPSHATLACLASAQSRVTVVLHLHGHPSPLGLVARTAIRHVDRFIAVSHSVADAWIGRGVDAERMSVVYNGVRNDQIAETTADERARARRDLAIPAGVGPVVGFVGKFSEAKGIYVLADAFCQFTREYPNACLVMLGAPDRDHSTVKELEARIGDRRRVILPDQADPIPIMQAFDLGVVPSAMEAFPMVVLELMACGIPVVGSRVGGMPEALGPDLSALLTPAGDVSMLANSLDVGVKRLSTDESFGHEYRKRAEQLDARVTAEAVATILRSAVPGSASTLSR